MDTMLKNLKKILKKWHSIYNTNITTSYSLNNSLKVFEEDTRLSPEKPKKRVMGLSPLRMSDSRSSKLC